MNSPTPKVSGRIPLIEAVGLTKHFGADGAVIPVLRDVSLKVYPGEMVAVTGPSGSGKSTLLYILGLLLKPTSGIYRLGGDDVLGLDRTGQADCRRRRLGFVFQSCDLMENSNVFENLEFPLIYAGVSRAERQPRVVAAMERVNLGHRLYHQANLLSGGERQRVAVARALVNRPQVILADEPTGQLDRQNSHMIMDHFEEIVGNGDTAVVVVTHDPDIARRCGRICPMEDGVLHGV